MQPLKGALTQRVLSRTFVALFLICGLFALRPAASDAQVTWVGKFPYGSGELDVATYTEGNQKVAVLAIHPSGADHRISFAFNAPEWSTPIGIWKKASSAGTAAWSIAGTMQETGTREPSVLVVYSGPTVNFAVVEPTEITVIPLARSDVSAFDAAPNRVRDDLGS